MTKGSPGVWGESAFRVGVHLSAKRGWREPASVGILWLEGAGGRRTSVGAMAVEDAYGWASSEAWALYCKRHNQGYENARFAF